MSRGNTTCKLSAVNLPDLALDEEAGLGLLGSPDKGHHLVANRSVIRDSTLSKEPFAAWTVKAVQFRYRQLRQPGQQKRRGWRALCCWPSCKVSVGMLGKFLVGLVALFIAMHATSCGFFFCYTLPGGRLGATVSAYEEIQSIYRLRGTPQIISGDSTDGGGRSSEADSSPSMIPKIIHQTYKSANVPNKLQPHMLSWKRMNPGWVIRFYDDEACLEFVSREFPQYLEAYRILPKHVERSDFFRYMVVLRYGGMYADIDTECRRPLSELLSPRDTLIAGWENEFPEPYLTEMRHYVRNRQILQWVFGAVPGHPALLELCDWISDHATHHFSNNTNRDTLERTGPGIWTDVILKHAIEHPPAQEAAYPMTVRLIAKVYWAAHPNGQDHLSPEDPRISVLHHFLGSWKSIGGWRAEAIPVKGFYHIMKGLLHLRGVIDNGKPEPVPVGIDIVPLDKWQLYPSSVDWSPPFSMMVPLKGAGDKQAGDDVAASITAWGFWQPALQPNRRPSVADVIVGPLGGARADEQVLLDIGAGLGLFSLAAAARGHRVIALEASPNSCEAFEESIKYNGWHKRITLHRSPAGAEDKRPVCLERRGIHNTDLARGYATAEGGEPAAGGECTRTGFRRAAAALVPNGTDVVAVRISAPGWENAILDGLTPLMESAPPSVVVMDLHPSRMRRGGGGTALALLKRMAAWGFVDVSHSGPVCDQRWLTMTKALRSQSVIGVAGREALKQPTWCRLHSDGWKSLVSHIKKDAPENLLFVRKSPKTLQSILGPSTVERVTAALAASSTVTDTARLRGSETAALKSRGQSAEGPMSEGRRQKGHADSATSVRRNK